MFFCYQNELHFHDVIKLFRDDLQSEGPDGTQLVTLGYILCFNFFVQGDRAPCKTLTATPIYIVIVNVVLRMSFLVVDDMATVMPW